MTPLEKLKKLEACIPAIKWVERNNYTTIEEIIDNCSRGDWLLWLAQKCNMELRLFTLAKGLWANTFRQMMKDERSIKGIDTAVAFGRGEASREELDAAASAAYNAAYTFHTSQINVNADYYAYIAYVAANAIHSSTYMVVVANSHVAASSASEEDDSYITTRMANLMQAANIFREVFRDELIRIFNEKTF